MSLGAPDLVTLNIPHPPEAYPQVKSIRVLIIGGENTVIDRTRLNAQVVQALGHDFNVDAPKAESTLKVTIVTFDPPQVGIVKTHELRSVRCGNQTCERQVPVEYWVGKGRLTARVQLLDNDDVPMDTFDPAAVFSESRELSVDGILSGRAERKPSILGGIGVARPATHPQGEGEVETPRPSTANEVNAAMLDSLTSQIRRRYVRTVDAVQFKLGCDDELRPGNRLAIGQTPEWEQASKLWAEAPLRRNEGDRVYNLAVAQEALAYKAYEATLNPADAVPFFTKATELYQKAQDLDRDEKYITASAQRLKLARANIARALDQRRAWEADRDRAREAFIAAREGQKALNTKREDTSKEKAFRQIARVKMASGAKVDMGALRETGDKMGVLEVDVQRIILQEENRLKGMGEYRQTFGQMVRGGRLTKDQRMAMSLLYPTLNMSADDAVTVEKEFRFVEEGVAAEPTAAPNDTRNPSRPAPPKPAKPTPAAKPPIRPAAAPAK